MERGSEAVFAIRPFSTRMSRARGGYYSIIFCFLVNFFIISERFYPVGLKSPNKNFNKIKINENLVIVSASTVNNSIVFPKITRKQSIFIINSFTLN